MAIKILNNPKCSKSRATLEIIEGKTEKAEIVEYLNDFPSREEMDQIVNWLNVPITEIIRFKESLASDLGITAEDDRTQDEWIDILIANPKLLERPIVIRGDRAVVGRPPENVLELF